MDNGIRPMLVVAEGGGGAAATARCADRLFALAANAAATALPGDHAMISVTSNGG